MKLTLLKKDNYSFKAFWEILGKFNTLKMDDKSKSYGHGTNPYCPNIKTLVEIDSAVVIENFKGRVSSGKTIVSVYVNRQLKLQKEFKYKDPLAHNWAKEEYKLIKMRQLVGDAF